MDGRYEYLVNIRDVNPNLAGFSGAVRNINSGAAMADAALKTVNTGLKNIGSAASGLDNLNFELQTDITPLRRVSTLVDSIRNKMGAVRMLVTANTGSATASIGSLRTQLEAATQRRDLAVNTRDIVAANREIASLTAKMQKLEGLPPQGLFARMGALRSSVLSVTGLVAGIGVTAGLASFGGAVVDVKSDFDKYNAVLTNTFSSQVLAGQAMKDLQKFAKDTPFQLNGLTDSYIKLVNRGFTPTMSEMRKLGDFASSQAKDFNQLAEAILDAETGEFERLKEFGVKAKKEGDNVTFSFKGQQTVVKNTEQAIRKYLLSLGDMQGVKGSMQAISGTLAGQLSNLSDNYDAFKLSVGNAISPLLGFSIKVANKLLDLGSGVVNSLLPKFEKWGAWVTANTPLVESALQGVGIAVGVLTAGFVALNATMLLNPMFLITAGITAGVVGFGYLWAKSELFRASVTGIWEVSKGLFTSFWENGKQAIGGLIDLVSGLVAGMKAAVNMDFSGAADNFKKAGKGLGDTFTGVVGLTPVGVLLNENKNGTMQKNFQRGFEQGKKDFQTVEEENKLTQQRTFAEQQNQKRMKEAEALALSKNTPVQPPPPNLLEKGATLAELKNGGGLDIRDFLAKPTPNQNPLGGAVGGGNGGGGGLGIGDVKGDAKAVRNISTTIQNLNINITLSTTNVTEGAGELKRVVGAALLDAVNDLNYAK